MRGVSDLGRQTFDVSELLSLGGRFTVSGVARLPSTNLTRPGGTCLDLPWRVGLVVLFRSLLVLWWVCAYARTCASPDDAGFVEAVRVYSDIDKGAGA